MIVTVTLNPAIDKTIDVLGLIPGALNKVVSTRQDPGGKGINVSRVLHSLGGESIATGFLAGESGEYIQKALQRLTIKTDFVWVKGQTRTNLKIFDQTHQEITELNEAGPEVTLTHADQLKTWLYSTVKENDLVVFSGSVPKSLDAAVYYSLIKAAALKGAKVFFDADGDYFKSGIEAVPHFIKPNVKELEAYFGRPMVTDADLKAASLHFIQKGIERVFITLGANGAYYRDRDVAYRLYPLVVEGHSSVGAGDAFVAACVYGLEVGLSTEDLLKLAVATSAGAVTTQGTNPAPKEWVIKMVEQVQIMPVRDKGDDLC